MKIIITIPAHNEANDIEKTIGGIRRAMDKTAYAHSVFVCDDGSTDETVVIAAKIANAVYTNKQKQGLARTFQEEMKRCLQAGADIIVHTDADGQYPSEDIPLLIEKIEQGHDLVIGSRFLNGIQYGGSRLKAAGNILFSGFMSALSGRRITDATSGFRAMNRKTATAIKIRSKFTYTYDQYLQAIENKLDIIEIPIQGSSTRRSRLMKNVFDYTLKALWDVLVTFRRKPSGKRGKGPTH